MTTTYISSSIAPQHAVSLPHRQTRHVLLSQCTLLPPPPPPPTSPLSALPRFRRRVPCLVVERHYRLRPPPGVRPAAGHPPGHRQVLLPRLGRPVRHQTLRRLLRRLRVRGVLRSPRVGRRQVRRHRRAPGSPDPPLPRLVQRRHHQARPLLLRLHVLRRQLDLPQAPDRPVPDRALLQGQPLAARPRQGGRPIHVREHFRTSALME